MLHAVIMAGGSGTRFWPLSREALPKQLLPLAGEQSMIVDTVERLSGLVPAERVWIATSRALAPAIAEQLPQLSGEAILAEPCRRDTAPCIGLAAHWLLRGDPNATMAVLPSDHVITPSFAFRAALEYAESLVEQTPSRIVTFGVRPTYAAESYGYIERAEPITRKASEPPTFRAARFREKPKGDVAREYVEAGTFYWNAGIFVWKARTILDLLAKHEPAMAGHLSRIGDAAETPAYNQVLEDEFAKIAGKSIDYAVMERADDVVVVEAPFTWDDLGSWQAIARLRGEDEHGNTIVGKHLGIRTTGTIVRNTDNHLVATLGLKDCLIVHTPDATLVANKHDEEAIRELVKLLREQGLTEYL